MERFFLFMLISASAQARKILTFGGNGNIGSEVLLPFIENKDDITLVSRGSWHFDNGVRIMPYVKSVVCDRAKDVPCAAEEGCDINSLKMCEHLMKVVNATDKFDVVLDFSGYEPKWIHDAAGLLKGKVGVYIFISTDSVYEVCEPKKTQRPSEESDAKRPKDLKLRKDLAMQDRYGNAKLGGEEALVDQRANGGFPWVALRLADVVGPRDTTRRWFLYQLWIKFYHDLNIPVFIPKEAATLTQTLTYVKDVSRAVQLVLQKGESVYDNAYNIGMEDVFTLEKFIRQLADVMEVEGVELDFDPPMDRAFHLYPTVYTGSMSIEKAKEKLGFEPTPSEQAFKETVEWYEKAFLEMPEEREEMIGRMFTYVVPRKSRDALYLGVDRELRKNGIVTEKYKNKRKGDLADFDDDEEADIKQEL